MTLEPTPIWKAELANIAPSSENASAAQNLANWYAQRIMPISPNPSVLLAPGFVFTFPAATFQGQLTANAPVNDPASGAMQFANAWEAAILSSVAVVAPGASLGVPSPATTFSVVISTIIDPPSIALGKAKILELASAPPASTPLESKFADIFYEATTLLTITVTGLNSVVPPAGPQPLTAPLVPLS